MTPLETNIYRQLTSAFAQAEELTVQCEGNHCAISIRCNSFTHQKPVQRQQRVNACLKDFIASGEVHALRIDAQPVN